VKQRRNWVKIFSHAPGFCVAYEPARKVKEVLNKIKPKPAILAKTQLNIRPG
jgi:hypothetical protein